MREQTSLAERVSGLSLDSVPLTRATCEDMRNSRLGRHLPPLAVLKAYNRVREV
jgi:hypothetical protein